MTWNCAKLRRGILAAGAMTVLWPAIANAAALIGGVYSDSASKQCGNGVFTCEMLLAAVPAGKTLIVDRVTCAVRVPSTAKISYMALRRSTTDLNVTFQYLAPLNFVSTVGSETDYLLNADARLGLKTGERPSIRIVFRTATAFPNFTCTVAGVLK